MEFRKTLHSRITMFLSSPSVIFVRIFIEAEDLIWDNGPNSGHLPVRYLYPTVLFLIVILNSQN